MILAIILAQAIATPSPSPVPSGSCFHEATVVKAMMPNLDSVNPNLLVWPLATDIEVWVEPDGSVGKTTIRKSSGYRSFDLAAERAARAATYTPKVVDCKAVEGVYTFRATARPSP